MERAAEEDETFGFKFHDVFMDVVRSAPCGVGGCAVAVASRPGRATAASANRAIGKRRTGARTCAGISSKRARAPAARPPSPPFLLPVPDETQRPRPDCNRVYIAAGPPQSTVLSPRQARVDRAPDSRVLRPSESLKVDSRRARSRTHTHPTDTQGHRTGPGQGGATARGVRQADPAP